MNSFPQARNENIVIKEAGKELLIYDLITHQAFCLNETSAMIYQLSDGSKTITEISELMSRKLKTTVSEDFVWLALDQLKKDDLLENADELESLFSGLSRREVIRKVGFASMVAFPIISSLAAPSAAMATSCAAFGEICIVSNGSQSNCCTSTNRCSPFSRTCGSCLTLGENQTCPTPSVGCCAPLGFPARCCSGSSTEGPSFIPGEIVCVCN